jgi:hypothetical protein
MLVYKKQVGSLAASNILTLCPNHHREVHFGCIEIKIGETGFVLSANGTEVRIARLCGPAAMSYTAFCAGIGALGTLVRYYMKRQSMLAIPAWTTPPDAVGNVENRLAVTQFGRPPVLGSNEQIFGVRTDKS